MAAINLRNASPALFRDAIIPERVGVCESMCSAMIPSPAEDPLPSAARVLSSCTLCSRCSLAVAVRLLLLHFVVGRATREGAEGAGKRGCVLAVHGIDTSIEERILEG